MTLPKTITISLDISNINSIIMIHTRSKRSTAFNFQDTVTTLKDIYTSDLFRVHTAPLVRRSMFWNNLVKVQKLGTDDNPIVCPGNRDTVAAYLQYICHGTIPSMRDDNDDDENAMEGANEEEEIPTGIIKDEQEWEDLCELHIFASKVEDEDAMDAVVDTMLAKYAESGDNGSLPTEDAIKTVYADTKAGSPLRRMLVDIYVWEGAAPEDADVALNEFLLDLTKGTMKRKKEAGGCCIPARVKRCDYHVHGAKGQCGEVIAVD
ncbi:Chaperone protein DnaJ [Teratosphaeria destructans]|uniref:Chaperone protein DnaJ n=1 Tax=Teratosphaeria destructans TaxID=418781 RepID=A0A9W7W6T4_9PEZI|nr:Chaperone protein DnaJ [Teratosphaeria destructans]